VCVCECVVCVGVCVCAAAHQLRGLHTASSRQVSVFVGLCVCECLVCVCVLRHTSSMGFTQVVSFPHLFPFCCAEACW
jgi:Na+-transporting NADH:ubiquinone oxidoreductase subunit NqrD